LPEATETGIIQRPVARIFVKSTKTEEWHPFRTYVDSGADLSLFRRNDADLLGLNINQGEYHPIIGVGRTLIPTYIHIVKLRIGDVALDAEAAFADSDEVPRLLGRAGIFTHFKITFAEQQLKIIFEKV
jgi:hypothetical protein